MNESQPAVKKVTLGLVLGWVFGLLLLLTGIFSVASSVGSGIMFALAGLVILPPIGKMLASKAKISLSGGLKFVLAVVLIILGIVFVNGKPSTADVATSPNNSQPAEQAIAVTAPKLLADYEANEVAADAQYKNKLVNVSGSIYAIGKDVLDNPYVALNGNSPSLIFNVQCMFDKGNQTQLASLSKNQNITLQGRVSGKMGNVLISNCSIVR